MGISIKNSVPRTEYIIFFIEKMIVTGSHKEGIFIVVYGHCRGKLTLHIHHWNLRREYPFLGGNGMRS